MILLYSIFFCVGCVSFFLFFKLSFGKRLLIGILVFLIPTIIITLCLIIGGDKPTEGARTIMPSELELEGS